MSIRLMSMIFDADIQDMKAKDGRVISASAATFVLLALADHANDDGEHVYPSEALISKKTKLSIRTVNAAFDALELIGLLAYKRISKMGTKEYVVDVEKLKSMCHGDMSHVMATSSTCHDDMSEHVMATCKPSVNHHRTINTKKVLRPLEGFETQSLDYEECDEFGFLLDEKPKKKKAPRKQFSSYVPLAEAIARVCDMDYLLNASRIDKEARALAKKPEISPELLYQVYGKGGAWYKFDWRGKKGQMPTPEIIKETYVILLKTSRGIEDITGDVRDRGRNEK